jgi:hypothetical protein
MGYDNSNSDQILGVSRKQMFGDVCLNFHMKLWN